MAIPTVAESRAMIVEMARREGKTLVNIHARLDYGAVATAAREFRFTLHRIEWEPRVTARCNDCGTEMIVEAPLVRHTVSPDVFSLEWVKPMRDHFEEHESRRGSIEAVWSMYDRAAVAAFGQEKADELRRAREKYVAAGAHLLKEVSKIGERVATGDLSATDALTDLGIPNYGPDRYAKAGTRGACPDCGFAGVVHSGACPRLGTAQQ